MAVEGTCAGDFAAVREEFDRNFAEREEVGASVSVTVDGETVVDLWGGVADAATGRPWERDTIFPGEPRNEEDSIFSPELLMAVRDSGPGKDATFNFVV